MKRRLYILIPLLFVTSALGVMASSHRPNVVILYADDMGYGDLAANNLESKIPTPHLDKLAAEGMRFTDGHSSSGICTPSRFALLTGQYHWRRMHGIVQSFGQSVFKADDFTIAKMFQKEGYNTAAIGKWHLGWDWQSVVKSEAGILDVPWPRPDGRVLTRKSYTPEAIDWTKPVSAGPLDQGFDYYFGDGTINFPPYCYIENDRVVEAPTVMMDVKTFKPIGEGSWEFRPGPMVEGWDPYEVLPTITDKAVAWIEQQQADKPFFLYFAFPSPHAPIIPNDEFLGTSQAGAYGDFVVETDAMAGRIIQALKDAGLDQNTIVIFTADNGAEQYAFAREQKFEHWSSGEFRGLKRDLWEGGHRVPTIISWPGVIGAGIVSDEVMSQVDFMATFAAILGYELSADHAVDSHSLLPILKGEEFDQPLRMATIQNTRSGRYAIRQGDWVYINASTGEHSKSPGWFNEARGYTAESTPRLLFNLKRDPGQLNNLYDAHPERVESMKLLLDQYLAGESSAPHTR
ncbi:MAG: sulfatase family protein [Lentimonas sp.]